MLDSFDMGNKNADCEFSLGYLQFVLLFVARKTWNVSFFCSYFCVCLFNVNMTLDFVHDAHFEQLAKITHH